MSTKISLLLKTAVQRHLCLQRNICNCPLTDVCHTSLAINVVCCLHLIQAPPPTVHPSQMLGLQSV